MMMKNLMKKLRSRAGESLIEALAAILIFTLASQTMYSMVTAAAGINKTAKNADRALQEQLVVVERADDVTETGTVTMALGSNDVISVTVDIYGGKDGALYSYFAR